LYDQIFKFGLRAYRDFLEGLVTRPKEEMVKVINDFELRELWQTFMTGNFFVKPGKFSGMGYNGK
jgi:hypothetical protein